MAAYWQYQGMVDGLSLVVENTVAGDLKSCEVETGEEGMETAVEEYEHDEYVWVAE